MLLLLLRLLLNHHLIINIIRMNRVSRTTSAANSNAPLLLHHRSCDHYIKLPLPTQIAIVAEILITSRHNVRLHDSLMWLMLTTTTITTARVVHDLIDDKVQINFHVHRVVLHHHNHHHKQHYHDEENT